MGFWDWLTGGKNEEASDHGFDGTGTCLAEPESGASDSPETDQRSPPWWAPQGACVVELQNMARPDLPPEARALEAVLVSHFDGHDLNMPSLPQVVERVLGKLRDSKCSLAKIADMIAEDQVVTASVLRMANSPLYRGLNRIAAIRPAVTRLGSRAVQTLMLHESVRSTMFQATGSYKEYAKLLWRCSFAGACVMRELARFTTIDAEDAFLIGLLHDIGSVIVLRIAHNQKKFTHHELDIDIFDYLCAECHQEFGELVADAWKLPPSLKNLIADHHRSPAGDDPQRTERLLLQVSDMCCSLLGHAPYVAYNLLESHAVKALGLHDRPDFTKALHDLPGIINETVGNE
ncbi:MAG: HDOD domain-containing protein [Planctomycetes bacterium]|nr:HDOD domain-containing protein [Planctomycetota bacterium]